MSAVVPVAFFTYRRPDLVAKSLASLRANNVPLIYAFSDGAARPEYAADVAAVRALLHAVDWTRIEIVEQTRNVGVSANIFVGITAVLERHDSVFVVEEDLEFVPGTYPYICAALERYRTDAQVFGVAAWNHPRVTPENVTAPYFSGRSTSLLWGTWKRAWDGVLDHDCASLVRICADFGIDPAKYGDDNVNAAIHEHTHGMWDHRFNLHMLAAGGLFLWPARSMGAHLGYDPRATNSPNGVGWEDAPSPAPDSASVPWPDVVEHPGAAEPWRRAVNAPPRPSFVARAVRKLRRLLGGR